MTSGNFHSLPITEVIIDRADRQRHKIDDIDALAASIASIGLINPIVLRPDNTLVAGERRYNAVKQLGWSHISIQYTDELTDAELALVELEENVRRKSLTWQEECLAVDRYHSLQQDTDPGWTMQQTSDALVLSGRAVRKKRALAQEIRNGNEKIVNADKFSVAANLLERANERKKASITSSVNTTIAAVVHEESPPDPKQPTVPLINADFIEWTKTYDGPRFNLIHCDFPYGINADNQQQGSNVEILGGYTDDLKTADNLMVALGEAMSNVIAESAHLVFWFSMDRYSDIYHDLVEFGWQVNPFPLVWHKSCNSGLLPDPNRGPRRTYETAFFCTRGDRKIVRPVANSISAPTVQKSDRIHMSEKPQSVLRHFIRMLCDEYSEVLDPTCGSGAALKAAENFNPKRVLGIEKDQNFYDLAKEKYYD